jgi:hypothetical protein
MPPVYHDAMGLFRRRAKKNREKAAAEPLTRQDTTAMPATAQVAAAPPEPTVLPEATAPPEPTALPEATALPETTAQPEATALPEATAPRAATAETRPNPDRPGWGESIGQQIGKARGERASQ